jgi:hypothetical protein
MALSKLKVAAIAVAALCTLGMLAFLTWSIRPDERKPEFASTSIATLPPGGHMSVDIGNLRYFVIRPTQGAVYALAAPIENGEVLLPDTYWWKPHTTCKDFGLELSEDALDEKARFLCRDANQPADWQPRWQWNAMGRSTPVADAPKVDDMYRVRTTLNDDTLVFVAFEAN